MTHQLLHPLILWVKIYQTSISLLHPPKLPTHKTGVDTCPSRRSRYFNRTDPGNSFFKSIFISIGSFANGKNNGPFKLISRSKTVLTWSTTAHENSIRKHAKFMRRVRSHVYNETESQSHEQKYGMFSNIRKYFLFISKLEKLKSPSSSYI